jgi:hypothetical protein
VERVQIVIAQELRDVPEASDERLPQKRDGPVAVAPSAVDGQSC